MKCPCGQPRSAATAVLHSRKSTRSWDQPRQEDQRNIFIDEARMICILPSAKRCPASLMNSGAWLVVNGDSGDSIASPLLRCNNHFATTCFRLVKPSVDKPQPVVRRKLGVRRMPWSIRRQAKARGRTKLPVGFSTPLPSVWAMGTLELVDDPDVAIALAGTGHSKPMCWHFSSRRQPGGFFIKCHLHAQP